LIKIQPGSTPRRQPDDLGLDELLPVHIQGHSVMPSEMKYAQAMPPQCAGVEYRCYVTVDYSIVV
jgi:hypothetical protein